MMNSHATRTAVTIAAILAVCPPCRADPALVIHYAPAENLEHIDVELIDGARHEIDMAAYVLTDWPVMQALTRAAAHAGNTCRRSRTDNDQIKLLCHV